MLNIISIKFSLLNSGYKDLEESKSRLSLRNKIAILIYREGEGVEVWLKI